jgi:hypothetical protein
MDVDVPEGRIESIKDFLLHIGTVTLGILIALGLEGIREWVHERNLVHEARTNLISELRDNEQELSRTLRSIPRTRAQMEQALTSTGRLAQAKMGETIDLHLSIGFSDASLLTVNRSTAQTTGALGHMSYGEVRKYAVLYQGQERFVRAQQRFIDQLMLFMSAMRPGRGDQPSQTEIDGTRQNLLVGLALLDAAEQLGKQLEQTYQQALTLR